MGSIDPTPSFNVLRDTRPEDKSLPAFMVSTTRGFLPRMDPIVHLPSEFEPLDSLLARMPVKTLSGEPGLLALNKLGEAVDGGNFPNLTQEMDKYKDDLPLMNALYRDYSFLASAYLLEPCHERFVKGESYGLGRQTLPANIAHPIAKCAEICGFKPFMEYAGSYALFNYYLADPKAGLTYDNLRLIRAFEHGLDPTSSEAGFVLVHIDMVKESGPLVEGTVKCLDIASDEMGRGQVEKRKEFNEGLGQILGAMKKINGVMETMWMKSKPMEYTSFRTFIFGITSQSMFPNGVVYEGLNNNEPMSFRGESGANDSMVPLMDNFLQVPMPETPLTEILKDFRSYRPSNHKGFLLHVKETAQALDLKNYALDYLSSPSSTNSPEHTEALRESRSLWLQILNQVRDFRWRHWCFAREYILKRTSHPTATGGSPIVTWLPNQLEAVLEDMVNIHEKTSTQHEGGLGSVCEDLMEAAIRQRDTLRKEVDKYCAERGVQRG